MPNMMGIKSHKLYEQLTKITIDRDTEMFQSLKPQELFPDLLEHMTETIPKEIFIPQTKELTERFKKLGQYLDINFAKKNKYPFTIQRICELCYHPLKYYKVNELPKFLNALERCCLVTSKWDFESNSKNVKSTEQNDSDVSLSKIKWLDEKEDKELMSFIKEIEGIITVNFGYDDEEEEEEDTRDMIIQEYYEDDGEDDQDYIEEQEEDSTSEDDEPNDSPDEELPNTLRKRKPTEIDDYDYETQDLPKDGTPKKAKQETTATAVGTFQTNTSTNATTDTLIDSPLVIQTAEQQQQSTLERHISLLVSPTSSNEREEKAIATTDDESSKIDSPLGNKIKR